MYILAHGLSSLDYRKMFLRELIVSDTALFHIMATFPITQTGGYSAVTYLTIQGTFDGQIRGMTTNKTSKRRCPLHGISTLSKANAGWEGLRGQMILRAMPAVALATGRTTLAGQVKVDDPDDRGYPGPPGWGWA